MKLTVLGGSAAGPNPGQGCSGYLVESGPTRIVLDLGPGTLPELRRHTDFRALDAVVLSHLHLDHILDILALRFSLAYNPIPPAGPIPLWTPPGGAAFFTGLAAALAGPDQSSGYFSTFDLREYDPQSRLAIGEMQITFTPTIHYLPCWTMRVSNGIDGDLFYTADAGPTSRIIGSAQGVSVMIAEGAAGPGSPEPVEGRGHLTPAEAGALAYACGAESLVLSHLWAEHNQLESQEEAAASFGGPVLLATPGLHVTWGKDAIEGR